MTGALLSIAESVNEAFLTLGMSAGATSRATTAGAGLLISNCAVPAFEDVVRDGWLTAGDSILAIGMCDNEEDRADGPPPRNEGADGEGAEVPLQDELLLVFFILPV